MFLEWDGLYHFFHNYITRFAVPFFFISSGFFFSRILENKDTMKSGIKHYSIRLLRPFAMWGSFYFVISFLEMILVDKTSIYTAIKYKLHLLLVESPGGGLWYVEALLWICLIVRFTYKNDENLRNYLIIGGILYLIQGTWNLEGLEFASILKSMYFKVFLSERTFIFYGIYFFIGIFIALNMKKMISSPIRLFLLQVILYVAFAVTNLKVDYIVIAMTSQLIKGFIAVNWFLIALNISNDSIPNCWLKYNSRKVSTIIYFTHFTAIYFVKFVYKILNIEFNTKCTIACLICIVLLIAYAVLLCQSDKKKKIISALY